jgi:hypothetical protein
MQVGCGCDATWVVACCRRCVDVGERVAGDSHQTLTANSVCEICL